MTLHLRSRRNRLRWGILLVALIASTACGDSVTVPGTEAPSSAPATTSAPVATTTMIPATPSVPATTSAPVATTSPETGLAECAASVVAGSSQVRCGVALYDLAIPDDCFDTPCGLIVDYPPGSLNGEQTDAYTNMKALGNAAGYVVVQPNSGHGPFAARQDRAFFDALIAALSIDASRVHVGGASMGGWQTWYFICDHSDLIASAAPHASGAGSTPGTGACDFDENHSPAEQVDILISHGRSDTSVAFSRGVAQVELVVDAWGMTLSEVLVDDPDYRWTRWTNDQETVLEFLEFDWTTPSGEGHCYPGGVGSGGCGIDTPVHYGEAALAFYIAHPKDG